MGDILSTIPKWLQDAAIITAVVGGIFAFLKETLTSITTYKTKKLEVSITHEKNEDDAQIESKKIELAEKDQLVKGMDTFQKGLMAELDSVRKELWTVKEKVTSQQNEILNLMLENFNMRNENTQLNQSLIELRAELEEVKDKNKKLTEALLISDKRIVELESELSTLKQKTTSNSSEIVNIKESVQISEVK